MQGMAEVQCVYASLAVCEISYSEIGRIARKMHCQPPVVATGIPPKTLAYEGEPTDVECSAPRLHNLHAPGGAALTPSPRLPDLKRGQVGKDDGREAVTLPWHD